MLYNLFLSTSTIPSDRKHSVITPIFKKYSSNDPSNYRPITSTCIASKITEGCIKNEVIAYMCKVGFISKHQHGFLAKHSTVTQMFECVNDCSFTLNICHSVDVIYVGFAKVFDKVVHPILVFKLQSYGIDSLVLKWIEQFLIHRLQCVRVNGYYSSFIAVLNEVSQRNVLRPILFLIFINDICDVIRECSVKLFADDVKLYVDISCNNYYLILQEAITFLHNCTNEWQLEISYNKCKVLHLGAQHQHADHHLGYLNQVLLRVPKIRVFSLTPNLNSKHYVLTFT